jgi:hypothetical protein
MVLLSMDDNELCGVIAVRLLSGRADNNTVFCGESRLANPAQHQHALPDIESALP